MPLNNIVERLCRMDVVSGFTFLHPPLSLIASYPQLTSISNNKPGIQNLARRVWLAFANYYNV